MRTDPDCIEIKTAYKTDAAKYKILVRNYEIKKERRVITANNSSSFYNFINRKLSCKSGIGALCDDTGRLVTGDEQRSNILNQFFSSVGCTDSGVTPNIPSRVKSDINLESVWFDRAGVMKAIKKLKSNSASGPDGLPPLLFKRLGACLAEPLSAFFNSFSVHQMPNVWSKAIITPVFKSGKSCDVSNYRPISLTCVACKLMERIISMHILDYLRVNNLITKHQHGFMSRRSTVTNLLESCQ